MGGSLSSSSPPPSALGPAAAIQVTASDAQRIALHVNRGSPHEAVHLQLRLILVDVERDWRERPHRHRLIDLHLVQSDARSVLRAVMGALLWRGHVMPQTLGSITLRDCGMTKKILKDLLEALFPRRDVPAATPSSCRSIAAPSLDMLDLSENHLCGSEELDMILEYTSSVRTEFLVDREGGDVDDAPRPARARSWRCPLPQLRVEGWHLSDAAARVAHQLVVPRDLVIDVRTFDVFAAPPCVRMLSLRGSPPGGPRDWRHLFDGVVQHHIHMSESKASCFACVDSVRLNVRRSTMTPPRGIGIAQGVHSPELKMSLIPLELLDSVWPSVALSLRRCRLRATGPPCESAIDAVCQRVTQPDVVRLVLEAHETPTLSLLGVITALDVGENTHFGDDGLARLLRRPASVERIGPLTGALVALSACVGLRLLRRLDLTDCGITSDGVIDFLIPALTIDSDRDNENCDRSVWLWRLRYLLLDSNPDIGLEAAVRLIATVQRRSLCRCALCDGSDGIRLTLRRCSLLVPASRLPTSRDHDADPRLRIPLIDVSENVLVLAPGQARPLSAVWPQTGLSYITGAVGDVAVG